MIYGGAKISLSYRSKQIGLKMKVCIGCGKDLSNETKNKCDTLAKRCIDAIDIWKEMFLENVKGDVLMKLLKTQAVLPLSFFVFYAKKATL